MQGVQFAKQVLLMDRISARANWDSKEQIVLKILVSIYLYMFVKIYYRYSYLYCYNFQMNALKVCHPVSTVEVVSIVSLQKLTIHFADFLTYACIKFCSSWYL